MESHLLILLVCIPNTLQHFFKNDYESINLSLPCEEGTLYPIVKNCRKYYKCINGKFKLRTCPGIDEFSPVYKWCLPPNLARCWRPPKEQPTPATCIIAPPTTSKPPAPRNATTTKPPSSQSTTSLPSKFVTPTTVIHSLDNATEVTEESSSAKVTLKILTSPSSDELLSTPNKHSSYESTATVVISSTESSSTKTTPFETSGKTVPPPTLTVETKTPDQWHTTLLPSSPGELPSQKDKETTTANEVTTVQLSTKNKENYSTTVSTSSDKQLTDITKTSKINSEEMSTLVFSTPSVSNDTIPFKTTISTSTIKDSTETIVPSESTSSSPGITKVSTREGPTETTETSTKLPSQKPYFVTTEASQVPPEKNSTITSWQSHPSESPKTSEIYSTPSATSKPSETTITAVDEKSTEPWTSTVENSTETKPVPVSSSKTHVPNETTTSPEIKKISTKEGPTLPTQSSTKLPHSQKPYFVTTEVTSEEIPTVSSGSTNPNDTPAPSRKYSNSSIKTTKESTETTVSTGITKNSTEPTEISTELPSSQKTSLITIEVSKVTPAKISTITSGSPYPNDTPKTSETYSTPSVSDKTKPSETKVTSVDKKSTVPWSTIEISTETKSIPDSSFTTVAPTETSTTSPENTKLSTTEGPSVTSASSNPNEPPTPSGKYSTPSIKITDATQVTFNEISTVTSGSSNRNESPKTSETYSTPSVSDKRKPSETKVTSVDEKSTEPWSTVEISTETKYVPDSSFTTVVPTEFSTTSPGNTKLSTKEGPSVTSASSNPNDTPTSSEKYSTPSIKTTDATEVTSNEISTVTSGSSNPNESPKTSETYSTPSVSDKTKPSETEVTSVDKKSTELWSTVEISTETKYVPDSSFTTVVPTEFSTASPGNTKLSTKEGPSVTSASSNPNDTHTPSEKYSTPSIKTTDATEVTSNEISTVTSGSSNPNESTKTSETNSTPSLSDKTKPSETKVTSVDKKSTEPWSTVEISTETKSVPDSSFTTVVLTETSTALPENTKLEGPTVTSGPSNPNDTPTPSEKYFSLSIKTTEATPVTSEEISTLTSGSSHPNESPKTSETYSTPSATSKTKPSETTITVVHEKSTQPWTSTEEVSTETKTVLVSSSKTDVPSEITASLGITKVSTKIGPTEPTEISTESPSQKQYFVTTEPTQVNPKEISTITSESSNPNELPKTSERYSTPSTSSISSKTNLSETTITSVDEKLTEPWTSTVGISTETISVPVSSLKTIIPTETSTASPGINKEGTSVTSESSIPNDTPTPSIKTTEESSETKSLPESSSKTVILDETNTTSSGIIKVSTKEPTEIPTESPSSQNANIISTETPKITERSKTSVENFTPRIPDKTIPNEVVNSETVTSVTLIGNLTRVEPTKTSGEETTTESILWISRITTKQSAETKSLTISTAPSGIITKDSTETTESLTKLSSSQTPYNVTKEATEVTAEGDSKITSESSKPSETQFTPSLSDKTTSTEAVNAKNITSVSGNLTSVETTEFPDEDTTTESIPWTSKKAKEESATTKSLPVSSFTTNTPSETYPISSGTTHVSTKESLTEGTQSSTELSSSLKPYNVTTEAPENTSGLSSKSSSCTSKSEPSSETTLTKLETSTSTNQRSTKTSDDKISTESATKKDFSEIKSTPSESTSTNSINVHTKEIPTKVTQSPVTQGIDLSSTSSYTHSEESLPSSTQVSSRETIIPISENIAKSTTEYLTASIKPEFSTDIISHNITTLEPYSEETLSTIRDSSKKQPPTPDSLIKITTKSSTGNPALNTEKSQRPLTSSPNDTETNVTSSSFTTAKESSSKITSLIPEGSSTILESVTSTKLPTLVSSPDLSTNTESSPNSLMTSSEQNLNISTTQFISSTESSTATPKAACEEGHLYPDPLSCNSYHFCVNGTLKQAYCHEYMEFSTLYHSCLPVPIAACSVSTSPSTTTTSQPTTVLVEPSCTEGERYPDPWGCQHYYLCKNASLVHRTCPSSTLFSYSAHSCMPATSVQCLQLSTTTTTEKICIEPGSKTTNKTTPTGPVTDKVQPTESTTETKISEHTFDDDYSTLATIMIDQGKNNDTISDLPSTVTLKTDSSQPNDAITEYTTNEESITETDTVTNNATSNINNMTDQEITSKTDSTTLKHPETTTPSDDYLEIVTPEKKKTFKPKAFTIGPHNSILDSYMCTQMFAYPHANNCSKFYLCEGGKLVVKDCPDGEEFSEDELMCLPADVAGCSDNEIEISIEINDTELSSESSDASIDTPILRQGKTELSSESRDANVDLSFLREGDSETKNLIPDLADCGYYISCVNHNCVRTKCVDSEEFSPTELKCLPRKQAGCKKPQHLDNLFKDTCPRYQHELTYHVYPDFCSYYYVCQYGKLYFYACPYGLEFSTSLLTCTSPSEANCTERNRRRGTDKRGFNIKFDTGYYKNPTTCKKCAEAASARNGYSNLNDIKYNRYGYEHSENNGYNKRDENSVKKIPTDKNNRTTGNFFSRWVQNRRDFIEKFLL